MATPGENERLSVTISPEQKAVLKDIAVRNEVSVARVIRQAVAEFIRTHSGPQLWLFDTTPMDSTDDNRP